MVDVVVLLFSSYFWGGDCVEKLLLIDFYCAVKCVCAICGNVIVVWLCF